MPEPRGAAPKPSGASNAEPSLTTLKTWVYDVGRLVESRTSKVPSDMDKDDIGWLMRYIAGNLKDMNEEFEKYAVKNDDWAFLNLAGKFRVIMKEHQKAKEAKSTNQISDSFKSDLATALNLVGGVSSWEVPTTDEAMKHIAEFLTRIAAKLDENPTLTGGTPWDNHTLLGKVKLIQEARLAQAAELKSLKADELKSVKAAYDKLRKNLAEEASYAVKDDKERRRRLKRIWEGKDPQHPDDLTDPDA